MSRRAWCRTTCVCCATAAWSAPGAARRIVATATTRVDLVACREAFGDAGRCTASGAPGRRRARRSIRSSVGARRRRRVLFLCTGNSARSQIAEALVEQMSGGSVEARSAGSDPKPLHPNAVRVLRGRGIDISANRTKHFDEFASERFDEVITLCDRVREVCPTFPSQPDLVHWSMPNPASRARRTGRRTRPSCAPPTS